VERCAGSGGWAAVSGYRSPMTRDDERMSMADLLPSNGNLCENISMSEDARRMARQS
jgi:hypothetical protein